MANGIPGSPKGSCVGRRVARGTVGGDLLHDDVYLPPVKANPGNVITCKVGGGHLGAPEAHDNEAPFPEALAEWFVRSFAPPGGLVCDPFSGNYFEVMQERCKLSKEEDEAKDNLIDKMKEYGCERYETPDGLVVTVMSKANVKCKRKKDSGEDGRRF